MEIDLERAKQALIHFGEAMEEARQVVRPGPSGTVRVHTDDKSMELPIAWAAAGLAMLAVASLVSSLPLRREREEEPLGIG